MNEIGNCAGKEVAKDLPAVKRLLTAAQMHTHTQTHTHTIVLSVEKDAGSRGRRIGVTEIQIEQI